MIEEYTSSNHDSDNLSFDYIYNNTIKRQSKSDTKQLLKPYNDNNCCDRICLWWFFHSSPGLNTYNSNPNDTRHKCICCNCCSWCLECKYKCKCCIKEIDCCCFTLLFE